uniref:transketolase n=2 Tax=Timema TaxID=61471 RepID=A0A7R9K5G7_TIMGE|nr:unnamed protein product [Timema genevievae]
MSGKTKAGGQQVVDYEHLQNTAHRLRILSIAATQASNSGHPTSCSSIAEIMSVLFFHTMKYNKSTPRDAVSDRFILSKGHAAPILYGVWVENNLYTEIDLLTLRKIDSELEGHPTPRLSFVDAATGSLGQGLSIAAGMAYVGKYYDKASYRVFCLIGDGESAEGSIWEALSFASYYKLDNLVVIFDINRLGQSEPTSLQHDLATYKARVEAFGLNSIVVDGHDVKEVVKAFDDAAKTKNKPTAVLAKTFKGKYFPGIEDKENYHGKPLGGQAQSTIEHLKTLVQEKKKTEHVIPSPVGTVPNVDLTNIKLSTPPAFKLGEKVAIRLSYGTALVRLATTNRRVIALDGDTKNSTYAESLKKAFPENYIECFIAEQNLVGVAIGAACRDRTVAFVSTFAAFFTRAFDQIRMGAISQTNVNFVGSHCGISIGEDGPSQMGLEDISMFRTIPGATVFYPSDAVSCERAVELAANTKGVCYIRTSRPAVPVLYKNDEPFVAGHSKIVKQSSRDEVLAIGAGVTLHEILTAAKELADKGIHIRVLDPFTIKPLDKANIIKHARECKGIILTVEDHYREGGIGEAVLSAVAEEEGINVKILAVEGIPRSGSPEGLLDLFGISAKSVVKAVQQLVDHPSPPTKKKY